jgi:hypothetical protein
LAHNWVEEMARTGLERRADKGSLIAANSSIECCGSADTFGNNFAGIGKIALGSSMTFILI